MNRHALPTCALLVIALTGMVGCAPSPTPTPTPTPPPAATGLPSRPATLQIDGVDPCGLLTPGQQSQLGVGQASRRDYAKDLPLQGTVCDWSTLKSQDRISYAVALLTNRGAEYALGTEPLRVVDGFAATATASALGKPQYECILYVDVAPGRSMMSHYTNDSDDLPGMTHQKACDNAQTAAAFMLANLRAAQPGGK